MNISKEKIDDLNAIIKVEIAPEDYQDSVDKKLREYRRKANMPGFRPGNVPMPIIRKMYRTSVLVEEINKLASEGLYNYIKENDIDVLGSPLHNKDKNKPVDWHEQNNFEFYFDIALQPEVDIKLEEHEVNYYNIKFNKEFIDKQVDNYRKNFGDNTNPEESTKEDRIFGKFEELTEDEAPKENGITHSASVLSDSVGENEDFIGLKKGDSIIINIKETFKNNETEIATILNISKDKVKDISEKFMFTVEEIHRIEPAEMNEEFYKKVFPQLDIKTEEAFREELEKEIGKQAETETDKRLLVDVQKKLVEAASLELPQSFLKRWLLENDKENKLTEEVIEKDFDKYAESMKWQIIENKIIKEYELQVTRDDVKEHIKSWLVRGSQETSPEQEKQIDGIVENILKNKEEAQRLHDNIYNNKLTVLFKEKIKTKPTSISLDDFVKLQ